MAVIAGVGGVAMSGATNPQLVPSETLITPCRLIDTRGPSDPVGGGVSQIGPVAGPLGSGSNTAVQVTGSTGNCRIPADATGVVMNVTVVGTGLSGSVRVNGFVTVVPANPAPNASNLNYSVGSGPTPNSVTVALSSTGQVRFLVSNGPVNLIADIAYGFNSIWALCTGTNRVIRVNATTNAIEASNISVGTSPNAVAVNANSVYVTNTGSNNVSRISPTTNTVAETIPLPAGAGPGEITRGADNSSLFGPSRDMWVVNGSGDSVSRITTGNATSAVTTFTAGIGTAPSSITFDGRNVWVGVTDAP